jgi:hypothetical protein
MTVGGTGTWTLASLASGASAKLAITVRASVVYVPGRGLSRVGSGYGTVPRGTTHWAGWPVTWAMMS